MSLLFADSLVYKRDDLLYVTTNCTTTNAFSHDCRSLFPPDSPVTVSLTSARRTKQCNKRLLLSREEGQGEEGEGAFLNMTPEIAPFQASSNRALAIECIVCR